MRFDLLQFYFCNSYCVWGLAGAWRLVTASLLFPQLPDPRVERTKDHLLIDIVAIAIFAVISGADGWVAIETYRQSKLGWLEQFLALPNGIPSHDTFARVFARLDPEVFRACFYSWIESITEVLGAQVIPIDGKTLKQSYDRNGQQKAIHIVSAWASEHRLVLGQMKVDKKSNEITAIPALLDVLEIVAASASLPLMRWGVKKKLPPRLLVKSRCAFRLLFEKQAKSATRLRAGS